MEIRTIAATSTDMELRAPLMDCSNPQQILECCVQNLLAQRYRHLYSHDMRSGLQSLKNGIELLVRATRAPGQTDKTIEQIAELTKRTLAKHDQRIQSILAELILAEDDTQECDLSDALQDLLHFLQNEIALNELTVRFEPAQGLCVLATPSRLRLVMLMLLTHALDRLPRGTEWRMKMSREGRAAIWDIGPMAAAQNANDKLDASTPELVGSLAGHQGAFSLGVSRQLLAPQRATIETVTAAPGVTLWRIRYPLK